ncbi:MAG: hypothetical protein AB7R89_02180 [Dehalococcoidia bacterium]
MQRIRASGLLQSLVAGREDLIDQLLRSEAVTEEEDRPPKRAARSEPLPPSPSPASAPPVRPATAPGIRQIFSSRRALRQAMILNEVLGPPKSLRQE